jgi:hypothetical protein
MFMFLPSSLASAKSTENSDCFDFSSHGYSLIVSDIILCHDLMHDNTHTSWVEVEIILHNVLLVDSCGIPLVLCIFQSLLSLFLHLCSQLDPLMVHYTKAPGYTVRDYSVVTWYYLRIHSIILLLHIYH